MHLSYFQRNKQGEQKVRLVLSPSHPVLDCSRLEVEGICGVVNKDEVLHVRIKDDDTGKTAHFHVSIGVKRGRPFCEVAGMTDRKSNIKSVTATWREPAKS